MATGTTCKNKITMEVEKSTPPYFRITTVRCGWTVANGSDVGTVYCDDHKAEAETDVRCGVCGVGGFKPGMLDDHYRIDCESE